MRFLTSSLARLQHPAKQPPGPNTLQAPPPWHRGASQLEKGRDSSTDTTNPCHLAIILAAAKNDLRRHVDRCTHFAGLGCPRPSHILQALERGCFQQIRLANPSRWALISCNHVVLILGSGKMKWQAWVGGDPPLWQPCSVPRMSEAEHCIGSHQSGAHVLGEAGGSVVALGLCGISGLCNTHGSCATTLLQDVQLSAARCVMGRCRTQAGHRSM